MNILSIDYGERYLGLAVYVTKSKTKFALKIVDTKKSDLIEVLKNVVSEYSISKVAIGYPIGLNNNPTRMSGLTDEFIKNILLNKLDIDVIKVDERMTSSVVTKSNKERIDDISALEILETYLSNV